MRPSKTFYGIVLTLLTLIVIGFGRVLLQSESIGTLVDFVAAKLHGRFTVDDRLALYRDTVEKRLGKKFAAAGLPYPPTATTFVAFKDSYRLEIYGRKDPAAPWVFVESYPILAASGKQGPKLVEGDNQIPEGIYRAESLNPNSKFHLAIRLNYPNDFDRQMAQADRRANLGGDIMIHGSIFSVGCLAIGDDAAEDLFVLAALSKPENVSIIISPVDFRNPAAEFSLAEPHWSKALYDALRLELQRYPK